MILYLPEYTYIVLDYLWLNVTKMTFTHCKYPALIGVFKYLIDKTEKRKCKSKLTNAFQDATSSILTNFAWNRLSTGCDVPFEDNHLVIETILEALGYVDTHAAQNVLVRFLTKGHPDNKMYKKVLRLIGLQDITTDVSVTGAQLIYMGPNYII